MKKLALITLLIAVFFSACDRKEKKPGEFFGKTDTIPLVCVELTLDTQALRMSGRGKPPRKPKPTPVDTTVVVNPTPPPTPNYAVVLIDTDGFKSANLPYVWTANYAIPDLEPYIGGTDVIIQQVRKLYAGYGIIFTTDENFYNSTSVIGKRMRCIVTPTGAWYPTGSGVAFTGSMGWGSSIEEAPCFVFSAKLGQEIYIGDIVAHEVGHTVGLSHQKDFDAMCSVIATYSSGKIMGSPFNTSYPVWFNQTKCVPQNDTLILRSKIPS